MSTADPDSDRDIGALLNELIDVVREIKQIEWVTHRGTQRQLLEELEDYLIPQLTAIADVEGGLAGPSATIVTPSAHTREPLDPSSETDPVRARLVPHLRAVAVDVRARVQSSSGPEADLFRDLASGLDDHADRMDGSVDG